MAPSWLLSDEDGKTNLRRILHSAHAEGGVSLLGGVIVEVEVVVALSACSIQLLALSFDPVRVGFTYARRLVVLTSSIRCCGGLSDGVLYG